MPRLENKIAIVTGAASGIGRAAARLFAREGARVVATDLSALDGGDAGEFSLALTHDVRSETRWQEIIGETAERFGGLDILVNCAGINQPDGERPRNQNPETLDIETWRGIQATNVEGVMMGCKHAIPAMRDSGGGAIVNISSLAGRIGVPGGAAYGASKAAVSQFTKSVALYCAHERLSIRCNAVLPGAIETPLFVPMTGGGVPSQPDTGHIPLDRLGQPEEVASGILFLASDEASYITGTELLIDGGLSAA